MRKVLKLMHDATESLNVLGQKNLYYTKRSKTPVDLKFPEMLIENFLRNIFFNDTLENFSLDERTHRNLHISPISRFLPCAYSESVS